MLRALARTRIPFYRAMSTAAPIVAPATAITLTPVEDEFVRHLDEFASNYHPPIECRIAGGWVRDKVREDLFIADHSCSISPRMTWTLRCRTPQATPLQRHLQPFCVARA